jgi:urocanate hydratase
MTLAEAVALRESDPRRYQVEAIRTMTIHCAAMVEMQKRGAVVFDYGNNLRQRAFDNGLKEAFSYPGFVPAYIRPLFCEGKGPFRWVALSGDPNDIYATDRIIMDLFPEDEHLVRWIKMAQEQIAWQGLPARICWLGYGERARAGLAFNDAVADGRITAPSSLGGITWTPVPSPAPTARPRRCRTAPTPSPTGPSSTPSSTRWAARRG